MHTLITSLGQIPSRVIAGMFAIVMDFASHASPLPSVLVAKDKYPGRNTCGEKGAISEHCLAHPYGEETPLKGSTG